MKPCDICLDQICGGKKTCKCETCSKIEKCPRYLHPTIRITTKCTQKCSHCCYSCSPEESIFMSEEVSKSLGIFLRNNEIKVINLMGGEFFCHPSWESIIEGIIKDTNLVRVRLVTNGDWAYGKKANEIISGLTPYKDILKIAISDDSYHTNRRSRYAADLCDSNNFLWELSSPENDTKDALIPIGRHRYEHGFFSFLAKYCDKDNHKYSFLIDEAGDIFKCPFGAWKCGSINDYKDANFCSFFVNFNTRYYSAGFMSCYQCLNVHDSHPLILCEGKNEKYRPKRKN